MRRNLILSIFIVLLIFSATACKAKIEVKKPAIKRKVDKKAAAQTVKEESKFDRQLKDIIMPAIDIIQQIRDVAAGVVTGDTKPDLAVAIYSGADGFLTETRVKITELTAPPAKSKSKDGAIDLIEACDAELNDLTGATKTKDYGKIKELTKNLDDKLTGLRSVAEIDLPSGGTSKASAK